MLNDSEHNAFSGMRKARLKQQQSVLKKLNSSGHRDSVDRAVYGNHAVKDRCTISRPWKEIRELEIKRAALQVRLNRWAKVYKTKKRNAVAIQMAQIIVEIEALNSQITRMAA